jgi:hypothetical protein
MQGETEDPGGEGSDGALHGPPPPKSGSPDFGSLKPNSGKPELGGEGSDDGAPLPAPAGVDPEEVRRAYELTRESTASICTRYGLTKHQFETMRVRGGWTSRAPAAPRGPLTGRKAVGADDLKYRMNRLATFGMDMLEIKVAANAGFDEASARTFVELCRARDIMMREIRNEKAAKARETKNNDSGRNPADDIAFIRAELERRIERLGRQGGPRSGDPSAEGGAGRGGPED